MFYIALSQSIVVLAIVNIAFWQRTRPRWIAVGCLALFLIGPFFVDYDSWLVILLSGSIAMIMQAAFLLVLVIRGLNNEWKVRKFFCWSLLGTSAIYAFLLVFSLPSLSRLQALRHDYPYESLEKRLPPPKKKLPSQDKSVTANARLDEYERELDRKDEARDGRMWPKDRALDLRRLHESNLLSFINSPGFGVQRTIGPPNSRTLAIDPLPETLPQPGPPFPLSTSPSEPGQDPGETLTASLRTMHLAGFADFVNYLGFGYVKDRRHVAGFQEHGFRTEPSAPKEKGLKVQRVELVGVLLHEQPVVYLTDGLPRMDRVRRSPTRKLDQFESLGMEQLLRGEDLFVRENPEGLRLLGAVRAIKQCIDCHDCQRGDLLGAFTYYLVKE